MTTHDLVANLFGHDVSSPPSPVGHRSSIAFATLRASRTRRAKPGARSRRSSRFNSARPGWRCQVSIRPSRSSSRLNCRARRLPAGLKRGSRTGTPSCCRNAARGDCNTYVFLLPRGSAQKIDHALDFDGRQRIPPRRGQDRRLVARGQPRQLTGQARRQQTQTQFRLRLGTQPLQQRQSPTDPTLVLAEQLRRFHLRQSVLAHQGLHDPRFLQLARMPTRPVEPEDRRLRRTLVGFDQTHAQRRPGDRHGGRVALETVEQLGAIVPPARRHRRQLAVTPQRPRHRVLRRRIGQTVAAIRHAQLRHRQRLRLHVRPGPHDAPSPTPPSTGRNGGTGSTGTRPSPSPSWGVRAILPGRTRTHNR